MTARARLLTTSGTLLVGAALAVGAGTAPAMAHAPSAGASSAPTAAAAPKFQLPFPCGQKWRLNVWGHRPALDMVKEPDQHGTLGARLVAAAAGTVNMSHYESGAGNVVQIDHGGRHFTTYIHLESRSVKKGAKVKLGSTIGYVGKSGANSNGHPHLHYEQGYDKNKDGHASWGGAGTERVTASFNGKKYSGRDEWRNVKSANKCGPKKYYVKTLAKTSGYQSPSGTTKVGHLDKGRNYVFCTTQGRSFTHQKTKSKWWLKTDLDSGQVNKWVPAALLGKGSAHPKDEKGKRIPSCK